MARVLFLTLAFAAACSFDLHRSSPADGARGGDTSGDLARLGEARHDAAPDDAESDSAGDDARTPNGDTLPPKVDLGPTCAGKCVTTLAGSGAGFVNGQGSAAKLNFPTTIVLAGTDLYVADLGNHAIRKVALDGMVSTLAGTGSQAVGSPTNGPALQATFTFPSGVAYEASSGAVYVADQGNLLVRKIAGGLVSTLPLDGYLKPLAITCVGSTLYFSTELQLINLNPVPAHRVYKSSTAGGIVSIVAGLGPQGATNAAPGSATFNGIFDLSVASNGDVYVADSFSSLVRLITLAQVTTVASGTSFKEPRGLALDAAKNRLFVSDTNNHCIREIALPTSLVSTVAGACGQSGAVDGPPLQARFNQPAGLALGAGALYIVDSGNHRIRRLDL